MNDDTQNKYSLGQIGLKKWIELESIRYNIYKAVEHGNTDELALQLSLHVSTAFAIPVENIKKLDWDEVAYAFSIAVMACIPENDYAILKTKPKQTIEVSWDYPNRTFYLWANTLASTYGWTLEYIAEMNFNDAIALIQEITVDEQLEKEWQWMMSELAYEPVKGTNRMKFRPLPRPIWMHETKVYKEITNTKILKSMLPVGAVMKMDGTLENVIH